MKTGFEIKEAKFKPIKIQVLIESEEDLDILDLYFNVDHAKQLELIQKGGPIKYGSNTVRCVLDPIYSVIQNIKAKIRNELE